MPGADHLGHAYPLIFSPRGLPPDGAMADLDLTISSSKFDPSRDNVLVTAITQSTIEFLIPAIQDNPFVCVISADQWVETDLGIMLAKVLVGPARFRAMPWSGSAVVEPSRLIVIPGASQSVEVYNKNRTRIPPKPGCVPPVFPEEPAGGYSLICGPLTGDIRISGGYNSRVFQYPASKEIQLFGDPLGGEAGSPCTGQDSYYDQDLPPNGRDTLDGAPRCSEVLRSINGISVGSFNFSSGQGVSVFSQPVKSRVTLRLDGAGSALCPYPEIDQADCPDNDDPYCGPIGGFDNCPDPPDELASIREKGNIPPIESLPIVGATSGPCEPLPSQFKYLSLRGCGNANALFDGNSWVYMNRCRSSCHADLPTDRPLAGTTRRLNCAFVPPDTTIGVRNPDFIDLRHWGVLGDPVVLSSHPQFSVEDMPAVRLIAEQAVYQTEIYVPRRSVLTFTYFGKIRLMVVILGKLCVSETLDSNYEVATYTGEYIIRTNEEIAIQFQAESSIEEAIVSSPILTSVI